MDRFASTLVIFALLTMLLIAIFAILPKAIDKSIANDEAQIQEHKAQIYISAADQMVIDWTKEGTK